MFNALSLIPFLVMVLWLAAIVYVIVLATRLVQAVEQIARAMDRRAPDSLEP
jgi:Ca2+/H+ antiporter